MSTVRYRKAKGRELQQEVAERISKLLGVPWGPDEEIASREMGQHGVDIRLTPSARRRFPFSVECKNQNTWQVPAWINQAKENTMDGTHWLLVCKRKSRLKADRIERVVILDMEVFFQLLAQIPEIKVEEVE